MKIWISVLSLFFLSTVSPLYSQFSNAPFYEAYPELPFNLKDVVKNNYQLVAIWHDEYTRSEGDESGIPWANQTISYQKEKHMLQGRFMDRSVFIDSLGNRYSAFQYYYSGKLISAIDELEFDSLQNEIISYSYHYAYKDTIPFQRVKLFNNDKSFRLLFDYMFDKENRLLRTNVTAHGEPLKEESIKKAEKEMDLLLVAHNKDSRTERHYKEMHDLQFSERIQFNEKGLPINKKIKGGKNELIKEIIYVYEDEILSKEIHTRYENKQPYDDKIIYYTFLPNGLPDRIITEKGDYQTVLNYQYYEEY